MASEDVVLVDLQGDPSPFPIPWRVSVMVFFMSWGEYIIYNFLPAVAIALFFLVVAWICAKFILLLLTRAGCRPRDADAVAFAFTFLIVLYGTFMTLTMLGINYQIVVWSLGLGTAAVSYTCATLLSNLFSGICNKYYNIVETNYCIRVGREQGVVEECGMLCFLLWNGEIREHTYLPNSCIFNGGGITYLNKEDSIKVAGPNRIVNLFGSDETSVHWSQHSVSPIYQAGLNQAKRRATKNNTKINTSAATKTPEIVVY